MFKRLAALFIVFTFASQVLAGGFVCDGGDEHDSAAEMSCCAQAKSANASPVAIMCCEMVCGEPTNNTSGPQSETPWQPQQVPAPPVTVDLKASFNTLLAAVSPSTKRSTDGLPPDHDPPALYLHNSAFLI